MIFNSAAGIPGIKEDGSTTDDPAKEVIVVTTKPVKSATMNDRFKIEVNDKGFTLLWENLEVRVKVKAN
ncbi:DUF2911 domain-containing protein [Mucilaginibacter sp. SMC90]|uniref:DUF2911 domain-containing protein n=1 Tax=Mucilaginibacter sp. SMC90 TaxID=2929803 RepID=UPI001FB1EB34|nr:DUF2911 domain-containing protein [Mucilaginibacter sp. SMC90]UOE52647.1 DUF2911 domain-containing protein [Mucilaginibacter sp. SMC90]